jgi:hypothetical protein
MKTYPRLSARVNSKGRFDAYLIKAPFTLGVWVHQGASIVAARAWLPERVEGA